jgi:putative PIN family toxin of toxin-antitoxin system
MITAVLDANIWLSLLLSRKTLPYLDAVLEGRLFLYSSQKLITETVTVSTRKKFERYHLPSAQEIAQLHRDFTTILSPESLFFSSPDIKDNYLFDLCRESQAEFLVTGDRALLAMKTVTFANTYHTTIISLKHFREMLFA